MGKPSAARLSKPCVKCGAVERSAKRGDCLVCKRAADKKYYDANKEKAAAYGKAYYEANKEKANKEVKADKKVEKK